MSKFFKIVFYLCTLLVACTLGRSPAVAAPFTGQVGVGTWSTQAEFTDIKVVQGSTVLYQSNFTSGMQGWTTAGGTWQTQNGALRQTSWDTPAVALVGNPTWSNYTLTLKARKLGGNEGFLITFGSPGSGTKTWWNIGGWGNTLHTLEVPDVYTPNVSGGVETGRWYNIRIQLQGSDVRCYLDGVLVHDTRRISDDSDRTARFQKLLTSRGFTRLTTLEQQRLQELAGRSVYIGRAVRNTFAGMGSDLTFDQRTPGHQALIIRNIINHHLFTWNLGWGFDGIDPWRRQVIIDSMDDSAIFHNSLGLFDKHVVANNSPGTPTADANYDGQIRFGGSIGYRVALHEIAHTLGGGTYWSWGDLMVNGHWNGTYATARVSQFDGPGSSIWGDGAHFWPYGLNYDSEYSDVAAYRHVMIVEGLRRDMGIHTAQQTSFATDVPSGTYHLMPRHAPNSALEITDSNPNGGAHLNIRAYTGAQNQKFLFDLQNDGSYRIRTALSGNRCVELPSGNTDNGTPPQLWDNNGNDAQRWYLIPMGDGAYKIAPKNNIFRCMDVAGISTADGAGILMWDYWDGFNQQWNLVLERQSAPNLTSVNPAHAIAGINATFISISGSGFVPSSVVRWNGSDRPTTFVSATELSVALSDADLATAGTVPVTVSSPAPGGGLSKPILFLVEANPGPPNLIVADATAQRSGSDLLVDVTLQNQGVGNATRMQLTNACRLNAIAPRSLPSSVSLLPAGGSTTVRLIFPGTAAAAGSKVTLNVTGTCDQGNFTGSRRIAVP